MCGRADPAPMLQHRRAGRKRKNGLPRRLRLLAMTGTGEPEGETEIGGGWRHRAEGGGKILRLAPMGLAQDDRMESWVRVRRGETQRRGWRAGRPQGRSEAEGAPTAGRGESGEQATTPLSQCAHWATSPCTGEVARDGGSSSSPSSVTPTTGRRYDGSVASRFFCLQKSPLGEAQAGGNRPCDRSRGVFCKNPPHMASLLYNSFLLRQK